jgi:hypothetical protein
MGDFLEEIRVNWKIENTTKKLKEWYKLTDSQFHDEISKQNKNISLTAVQIRNFNEKRNQCLSLKNEIETTDKEIDKMVYKLYGLTNDEIEQVENSIQ